MQDQTPTNSTAQNLAQSAAVSVGKGEESTHAKNENRPILPSDSDASRCLHIEQVAPTGLEPVAKTPAKQGIPSERGTESGTLGGVLGFAEAVAAVMRLPLSDGEKAEAVRRLLAGR